MSSTTQSTDRIHNAGLLLFRGACASRRAGPGRAVRTRDTGLIRGPERKKPFPGAAPALKSTPLWEGLDFSDDSLIAELLCIERTLLACAYGIRDLRWMRTRD